MCRIDAPFGDHPLNEKEDPVERFLQAVNEFEIEGCFRSLLIKHFSDNWQKVFRDNSGLEEALGSTKQYDSESEKSTAFLLSQKSKLQENLHSYLYNLNLLTRNNELSLRYTMLDTFTKEVAQSYFSNSPFDFFNSGMSQICHDYYVFTSWLYGKEFCFTQAFFDDEALATNGRDRTRTLWDYFYSMAPQLKEYSDQSSLLKELTSIASLNAISGPPTKDSSDILRGFEFIKTWIKYDSQAGRFSCGWIQFIYDVNSPWGKIESLLRSEDIILEKASELTTKKWLDDTKQELEKLFYLHADLSKVSDEGAEQWANGLNCYFTDYIHKKYDFDPQRSDEFKLQSNNELVELCSQLTPLQTKAWIKWSVDKDVQNITKRNGEPSITISYEIGDKWINEDFFSAWQEIFLAKFEDLDFESRVRVLSAHLHYCEGQPEDFYPKCSGWWKVILNQLIETNNFPKALIPDWTIISMDKLEFEKILPYLDKSIGILRGKIIQSENSEDDMNEYHQQFEKLLSKLDITNPTKSLRHRLFLMRSSTVPFSNESVSNEHSWDKEGVQKWYYSLKNLVDNLFRVNGIRDVTSENYSQVQNDFYVTFSQELAEFCLSRLRLRKGEKSKDGKYDSSQVVESSSIWRQGYLKALTELGIDLNGKVHKTVNFTKASDPEKDVRDIASECYKAVRRNAKKNPSIEDLKRGLISAEWWLLLCQRQELGLDINYEEALKTRRKLLRNP